NLNITEYISHDERYDWSEEYMHVVYKLWEESWEDNAVLRDIERGIWADPDKVHEINHIGERYSVKGAHQVEPSPQRSPVIFQAGSSPAGRSFAAKHAEMQFISAQTPQAISEYVAASGLEAEGFGRKASDL